VPSWRHSCSRWVTRARRKRRLVRHLRPLLPQVPLRNFRTSGYSDDSISPDDSPTRTIQLSSSCRRTVERLTAVSVANHTAPAKKSVLDADVRRRGIADGRSCAGTRRDCTLAESRAAIRLERPADQCFFFGVGANHVHLLRGPQVQYL